MKLGTRIFISLAIPILLLMALAAVIDQRRSRAHLREELAREGRAISRIAQFALEDALRDRQIDDMRELVDRVTGYERVLGLRVFDAAGSIRYQSPLLDSHPFEQTDALQRVLSHREAVEAGRSIGEEPVMTFIFPLSTPQGQVVGAVQLLQLESFIEEDARASRTFSMILTGAMVLASGLTLFLVTRVTVARPVEELVRRMREVGSGNLKSRIPVKRADEFGRIAQEFNAMCERLEDAQRSLVEEHERRRRTERQLRSAERLAGLGRLAAGLAHEIGTPLNVIGGRAESLLRRSAGTETIERNLSIIRSQIDRIDRIVRAVLDFARGNPPAFRRTEIAAVLDKVLEFVDHTLRQSGVRLEIVRAPDLPAVNADADQLHQVFLNLVMNAVDAMPRGGVLEVRCAVVGACHPDRSDPERPFLAIVVQDTGPGVPPEHVERVFEPFFTTKEVGKGTGLGLSVSYGIVQEHGGWIGVESDEGARFTVFLPVAEAVVEAPAEASA